MKMPSDTRENRIGKNRILLRCALRLWCALLASPAAATSARHQAVLEMKPVGYWPADDGAGELVKDLSPSANHGVIHHVSWDNGLLDFTNGYQWIEIPGRTAYQTKEYTVGGWVFSRRHAEGGGWPPQFGMLLIGHGAFLAPTGIQLCLVRDDLVDVVTGGVRSIPQREWKSLGKTAGHPKITLNEWQQVLYTYEGGKGTLYLDGRQEWQKEGLAIQHAQKPDSIRIGNDSYWWHQSLKSGSLHGSIRDMVWFDRALSAREVANLHQATRPTALPKVFSQDAIVVDQREIRVRDLPAASLDDRRRAFEALNTWKPERLQSLADSLLPALTRGLLDPGNCRLAAGLLVRLNHEQARVALRSAVPTLVRTVQDQARPEHERAAAVLALAAMGNDAAATVPALVEALNGRVKTLRPVRLPRVEEYLHTALIRALLDTGKQRSEARDALEAGYARPLLAALDLSSPALAGVRTLAPQQGAMAALEVFRTLPPAARASYFTAKAAKDRDYSSTAIHRGCTYKVGDGVAWNGVEAIAQADYEQVVAAWAQQYPAATTWRKWEAKNLGRVPLTKITPDGKVQKVYLEGAHFILDATDAKMRGWSIFADKAGYLHLVGGQHNAPNPDNFIPGSWEKMGLSRTKGPKYPVQMYWVSARPECIDSFVFMGQTDNPRAIPAAYLNYMVFLQDNRSEFYLYGRTDAFGWQSWGMYRYELNTQTWTPVGGEVFDIIQSARAHDPAWLDYLHGNVRGKIPAAGGGGSRPLVWAWQPPFYNFCRDDWGARFDRTNRLHLRMQIGGLIERGDWLYSSVYAYSDDAGRTFHRADGTPVALPLTIDPAPEHNADLRKNDTEFRWQLWLSLLQDAGCAARQ